MIILGKRICYIFKTFMNPKPNIRSRKIVFQSKKEEPAKPSAGDHRVLINPTRLPQTRVILRRDKKEEEEIAKVLPSEESKEAQNHLEKFQQFQHLSPAPAAETEGAVAQPAVQQNLQARDRKTLVKYDFQGSKYSLEAERNRLSQWLGEMHFKVVSTSFNLYITNQLTFEEVKVHCCQNLLLNILYFLENLTNSSDNISSRGSSLGASFKSRIRIQPLGHLELTGILKEINQTLVKNLAYMQIKYPLTKDTKPNKSLQSLIYKINNLGNDEHDMVMKSGVDFKLKKEDNYTPEIMKLLNFIITKQSESCKVKGRHNRELSYFEFFYQTMETIFTSVYRPDYEVKEKTGEQEEQMDAVALFANIMSQKHLNEENNEVLSKDAKEYKEKVMKYTHFLIGQKISPNTELYSDKEIETEIFDVRNSSILRILTKWTEELQKKIVECEENILKRPFRFKKNKPYEYSKLNANQKNDLFLQTKRRAKDVKLFNQQLQQNYNQIQSMISSHLQQGEQMKNIPKREYKVGYFCSKIQVAASSTLLSYLNKMIHILLLIPDELKRNHIDDQEYADSLDINLITFKIADLFRCKLKSKQAEIIRIFKKIKQISEKGEPFKIVRIKDRLNLGTRDILINVLFMNMFLCEIQLAVEEYVDAKQVSYDSFSHFLYELHRSRLGPVMESACTWAQFDQRSKIFRHLTVDRSGEAMKYVLHECSKDFIIPNRYPFICSLCERFYSTEEGLLKHVKCNLCRTYFQCTECIYAKLNAEKIAEIVNLPEKLKMFVDDFRLWKYDGDVAINFPKFGLLTSKKIKKPELIFFQTVIFKYDVYVIEILEDETQDDHCRINVIEKVVGNLPKNWKKVSEKYIIYEWKEKRNFNMTITPETMRRAMEEEKEKKEAAAKLKKEEKQKRRLQLQTRRREKDEQSDQDEGEQKRKKKKHQKSQESGEESQKGTSKNINQPKNQIYLQKIAKRNNRTKVRVINKFQEPNHYICVLGIYLKQASIRNKLKEMHNKDILKRINLQKIEVLFFEDEYIHDDLNGNESSISEVEKNELIQTLERVSEVYLDNNFIKDVDFLKMMTSLKVAHLSHNLISNLQPLGEVKSLQELVVQNNAIYSFEGLENKPQIVEINLNRNQLTSLQFFIDCPEGEFGRLKNFYLSGNEIENLSGIQKLTSLVKLDLSYNLIENIGEITTLTNLQELDLSNNKLKKLKGIQKFSALKKLYLNDNKIKKIPHWVNQLVFLTVLEMTNNRISKIKNLNTGAISKNLRVLNLSENKIQKMEGLDGLENLQVLNLSHNQIREIDNYLDLSSLVKLDISHNCLQSVDLQDAEKYLPLLKQLYLNSNPLLNSDFNKSVLSYLSKRLGIIKFSLREDEYKIE